MLSPVFKFAAVDLPDPETRGWGVVIVWDNPTFDSALPIAALPIRTRRYRFTPKARKTTT